MLSKTLTLVFLVSLSGCLSAPGYRPELYSEGIPGVVVRIKMPHAKRQGTGAVVGPNLVATVDHVSEFDYLTIHGRRARVIRTIPTTNGWEPITLLECDWGWDDEQQFRLDANGEDDGYVTWTVRGPQSVQPSFVIPGDSGSPVMDAEGNLVGHVSAVRAMGLFAQIGIVSYYPRGVQLQRIVVNRNN